MFDGVNEGVCGDYVVDWLILFFYLLMSELIEGVKDEGFFVDVLL